jgi:hypothetical protein
VGDPQPELASFAVASSGGGAGSGAALPDGTIVLAWLSDDGATAVVCTVPPGGRRCGSVATLSPYEGQGLEDSFSGVPEVLSTGGTDVAVVAEDCCHVPAFVGLGGAVVFQSTNDGASFSGETPAGAIQGVDAATFAGGRIVVASSDTSSLNVQALPPAPQVALTAPAHPNARHDGETSLSTYEGGLLVASDDAGGNTLVEYAPSGSDLNLSSSYRAPVGVFDREDLAGVSGNALLTYSSTASEGAFLRFFNGRSFGPSYKVPEPALGADGSWAIEDVGGLVHVFFVDRGASPDICSETTRDGTRWSAIATYSAAATAGALVPALGPTGAGLVFESEVSSPPLVVQPILDYQPVAIELARHRAPAGKRTYLTGQAGVHVAGQLVTLERRLSAGVWTSVAVARESPRGAFVFTVPGITEVYRAVVAFEPGYYLYGYSNLVTLTAVPARRHKS